MDSCICYRGLLCGPDLAMSLKKGIYSGHFLHGAGLHQGVGEGGGIQQGNYASMLYYGGKSIKLITC